MNRIVKGTWIAMVSAIFFLPQSLSAVSLAPEDFQFQDEFMSILENMLENHWRDEGGREGGVWLNRRGDPEMYYGKGDGSLFGSEVLYKLGLDDEIRDEDLHLSKTELVHRANRTVDHVVFLYRHLILYLLDPAGYARELEEAGTALPAFLQGLAHYSGGQNEGFPFEQHLSFVTTVTSLYSRLEGNLLATSDLGCVGALGMTANYDLALARLLGQGKTAERAARVGFSQLRFAKQYRVRETEVGHRGHVYYIHPPETPVIDAWANPMMLLSFSQAYQMSGVNMYLREAKGLSRALHDHLWDADGNRGYYFDDQTEEIHLAANNCMITGLLQLCDAAGNREDVEVYLNRAWEAIHAMIRELYRAELRVCVHDDQGWVDPNYYCTGCNLHFLKNVLDYNRLVQKGYEGVVENTFPVCAQLSRREDSIPAKLINTFVALFPLFVLGARRAKRVHTGFSRGD